MKALLRQGDIERDASRTIFGAGMAKSRREAAIRSQVFHEDRLVATFENEGEARSFVDLSNLNAGLDLPKDPEFNFWTKDIHGDVPDFDLLTTCWMHSTNRKSYRIVGFSWLGATDEWGMRMIDMGGGMVEVTRPIRHLTGHTALGVPRYHKI